MCVGERRVERHIDAVHDANPCARPVLSQIEHRRRLGQVRLALVRFSARLHERHDHQEHNANDHDCHQHTLSLAHPSLFADEVETVPGTVSTCFTSPSVIRWLGLRPSRWSRCAASPGGCAASPVETVAWHRFNLGPGRRVLPRRWFGGSRRRPGLRRGTRAVSRRRQSGRRTARAHLPNRPARQGQRA